MHSVRALIYKDRNRRIGARVRNMRSHFLHDEGIASDHANHLGNLTTVSLESRSNRRLFDIWHIQIILGEELDETGGDGGGTPARQVVARTRYRHRVDFWNPLLQ